VTFLNTGAHPDDERSDLLAYLSRGLGVKSASVIANRGEGGQNEIGTELGDGLGIIRSNEMIEAAKITGVKAYHLSETTSDAIYDFGFSKSPEETLEKWGEEITYERLIRFIRTYQPDIVMPSFRDVDNQHGHHRAMTILSERTFEDAADPSVFPEQLTEGLAVWQ
ncbi:PIG-L family deacetylase, partial [Microvirga sp. 3-52]|nr:PIG-L family deacetylase [Microvirga sp. 3-52]